MTLVHSSNGFDSRGKAVRRVFVSRASADDGLGERKSRCLSRGIRCVAACVAMAHVFAPVKVVASPIGQVSFKTDVLDFGDVDITAIQPLRGTIVLRNEGDQPVEITGYRVSCGCVEVDSEATTIAPRGERPISVLARPETVGRVISLEPETKRVIVSYRVGDEAIREVTANVRWRIVHPVSAEPSKVSALRMAPGETRAVEVQLKLIAPLPGERVELRQCLPTYEWVQATIGEMTCQIVVEIPRDWEPQRQASVAFHFESDQRTIPPLLLPLHVGLQSPQVIVIPPTKTYLRRPTSEAQWVGVRIRNKQDQKMKVLGVRRLASDGSALGAAEFRNEREAESGGMVSVELKVEIPSAKGIEFYEFVFEDGDIPSSRLKVHHAYD